MFVPSITSIHDCRQSALHNIPVLNCIFIAYTFMFYEANKKLFIKETLLFVKNMF